MDLSKYSIEEKVGQMFMVGFDGHQMNDDILNLIVRYNVSGVCYFSRNLDTPKQVNHLSKQLQAQAKLDFPLFLSIDQEGGMVNRITDDVLTSPSQMALGATDNRLYIKWMSEIVAGQLKEMGLNMNYAPAIDVNNNPNNPVIGIRSFGENVKKVSQMGTESMLAYKRNDIIPVVKHFPGHGDTATDSHHDLPIIKHDLDRIHKVELAPFKHAIKHGADVVMVSHLNFPAVDPENPATLSYPIVTKLLREELQFDGVITTDCMEMDAIGKNYTPAEAAVKAVKAGIDLLLFSHTYDVQRAAIDGVIEAVKSGEISEEWIDESFIRVMNLKKKRHVSHEVDPYERDEFEFKRNAEFVQKLTDASITVVKDDKDLLPLQEDEQVVVLNSHADQASLADEQMDYKESLGQFLKKFMPHVKQYRLTLDEKTIESCQAANKIIITTNNLLRYDDQMSIVQEVVSRFNDKVIVLAKHSPYDYRAIEHVSTYIAAYDPRPSALESASRLLTGQYTNRARLPVSISERYTAGKRYKF
ncbi:MAG TPA: glycoside hydrolase family 3 N-terminal domain-containing protein [Pseudogracilibacillus sp.]|nr:glycoside hydrolase family 3 N-terminal domain-containing protein [Pseudogracilibacillus sp.]